MLILGRTFEIIYWDKVRNNFVAEDQQKEKEISKSDKIDELKKAS